MILSYDEHTSVRVFLFNLRSKNSFSAMLTRLFPNKRPDALELVLHVCRGDVMTAIEHLLSGQEDNKRDNDFHTNRKRHASQERALRVCF